MPGIGTRAESGTEVDTEPDTWPVPRPQDGRAEARRFLDDLHARGAVDEGTPQVLDRLVDNWVSHWLRAARVDWRRACARAEQRIADAESHAEYVRGCMANARGRVAYARQALLRAGRRPEADAGPPRWSPDGSGASRAGNGPPPAPSAAEHGDLPWPTVDEPLLDERNVPSPARTVMTWALLSVMAGADAFGFWQTLVGIIEKDTMLTAFFVVALTIGAVLVAYQIGRMARRIADGYAGNGVPWLITISCAWLGLGLVAFWIRAHPYAAPLVTSQDNGVFGDATSTASSGTNSWSQTWGFALLLLLLYFATGILTITDAWTRESPRVRTVEFLTLRLREAEHEVASYRRHERDATAAITLARSASERVRRDHSIEDSCLDEGRGIKEDSRIYLAQLLGNPSNTAAVLNVPVADAGVRPSDNFDDDFDDEFDGPAGHGNGSD
jgi:hypothetical protein